MTRVYRAEQIARSAHAGQVDKQGEPYILHVQRVAATVGTEDQKVVAWLHDVLEDTTTTTLDLIKAGIDSLALQSVELLTRRKNETYRQFIYRIADSGSITAISVKLADLHDNLRPGAESLRQRYQSAIATLEYALLVRTR